MRNDDLLEWLMTPMNFLTFLLILVMLGMIIKNYYLLRTTNKTKIANLSNFYAEVIGLYTVDRVSSPKQPTQIKNLISRDPQKILDEKNLVSLGMDHVPGRFTGWGIAFTFLGIIIGLALNLNMDASAMLASIQNLLAGMRIAFITSFIGIAASVRFTSSIHKKEIVLYSLAEEQIKKIRAETIIETPQYYLSRSMDTMAAQAKANQGLIQAAAVMSGAAEALGKNFNTERIASLIGESIQSVFKEELKPTFERIDRKFDVLKDIKESTTTLTAVSKDLSKFITEDLKMMFKDIESSFSQTKEVIESISAGLLETRKAIVQTNEAISGSNKNIVSLTGSFDEMVKKMDTVLDKFSKETINLLKSTGTDISTVINEANNKLQKTLNDVSNELVHTSERVQTELGKFRDEYTAALTDYLTNQGKVLDEVVGKNIKGLNTTTQNLNTVFEEEYKRRNEIEESTQKTLTRLQDIQKHQATVEAGIKDDLTDLARESISTHSKALKELSNFQNKMDTDTGAILEYLSGIVQEFNSAVKTLHSTTDIV